MTGTVFPSTTANAALHPTIDTTITSNATHPNREAARFAIVASKFMGAAQYRQSKKHQRDHKQV